MELQNIQTGAHSFSYADTVLTVTITNPVTPNPSCPDTGHYQSDEVRFEALFGSVGEYKVYKVLKLIPYTLEELIGTVTMTELDSLMEKADSLVRILTDTLFCHTACYSYCEHLVDQNNPPDSATRAMMLNDCIASLCIADSLGGDAYALGCKAMRLRIVDQLVPGHSSLLLDDLLEPGWDQNVLLHIIEADGTRVTFHNYTVIDENGQIRPQPRVRLYCDGQVIEYLLTNKGTLTLMLRDKRCWQNQWAEDLAPFHREYCHYEACQCISTTREYDVRLTRLNRKGAEEEFNCPNCSLEDLLAEVIDADPFADITSCVSNHLTNCGNIKSKIQYEIAHFFDHMTKKDAILSALEELGYTPDFYGLVEYLAERSLNSDSRLQRPQPDAEWKIMISLYQQIKERIYWDCVGCTIYTKEEEGLFTRPEPLDVMDLSDAEDIIDSTKNEQDVIRHDVSVGDKIKRLEEILGHPISSADSAHIADILFKYRNQTCGPNPVSRCMVPSDIVHHQYNDCGSPLNPYRIYKPNASNSLKLRYHAQASAALYTPLNPNDYFQPSCDPDHPIDVGKHYLFLFRPCGFLSCDSLNVEANIVVRAIPKVCGDTAQNLELAVYKVRCNGNNLQILDRIHCYDEQSPNFSNKQFKYSVQRNYYGGLISYIANDETTKLDSNEMLLLQFYQRAEDTDNTVDSFAFEVRTFKYSRDMKLWSHLQDTQNYSHLHVLQELYDYIEGLSPQATDEKINEFISEIWCCEQACVKMDSCVDSILHLVQQKLKGRTIPDSFEYCKVHPLGFACDEGIKLYVGNNCKNALRRDFCYIGRYGVIYTFINEYGQVIFLGQTEIIDYKPTNIPFDRIDKDSLIPPIFRQSATDAPFKFEEWHAKVLFRTYDASRDTLFYHWGYLVSSYRNITENNADFSECRRVVDTTEDDCLAWVEKKIQQKKQRRYDDEVNDEKLTPRVRKQALCLEGLREDFWVEYTTKMYHYTLYYYDRAGNLIRTVPPSGVVVLGPQYFQKGKYRPGNQPVPPHRQNRISTYRYNSYDQLVESHIPDRGEMRYYYDYGRLLRFVQDAEQLQAGTDYNYYKYDRYGRVVEKGELVGATWQTKDLYDRTNYPGAGQTVEDVIRYIYSERISMPGSVVPEQRNLRGRLSVSIYGDVYTAYDYDDQGNVERLYHYQPRLDWKEVEYDYDLLSGDVLQMQYQPGQYDGYRYRYLYDADNRLEYVYTTSWGSLWDEDLRREYYAHGPVAREELGELKVQGVDYVYTLQGWLKSVNVPGEGSYAHEPGRDGDDTQGPQEHSYVGRDAMGFTLGYHDEDYEAIGAGVDLGPLNAGTWVDLSPSLLEHTPGKYGLLGGNIAWMTTDVKLLGEVRSMAYQYDQLHRLKRSESYRAMGDVLERDGLAETYRSRYTYDADGNIDSLIRYGGMGLMDSLKYYYDGQGPHPNRLRHVRDAVGSGVYGEDVDDQVVDNYSYDATGNLIGDVQGGLTVAWNAYERVEGTQRVGGGMYEMVYDGDLRRVRKRFMKDGGERNVYYVRDLSGEVLAVYTDTIKPDGTVQVFEQTEVTLKGAKRLGIDPVGRDMLHMYGPVRRRCRDRKRYELSNHLGNVLAVVSDRKFAQGGGGNQVSYFEVQKIAAADYYPYGQLHPGRYVDLRYYRYGYNGKEREERGEFGTLTHYDYGFRVYSPGLGRFWSVDPKAAEYAGWSGYVYVMGNPLRYVDVEGLEPEDIILRGKNNSSVIVKTDLVDITVDAGDILGDVGGVYTLEGEDVVVAALDIVGIVDPTGVADFAAGSIELQRGNYLDGAVSYAGILPYIGDIFKIAKLPKHVKTIRRAIELSRLSRKNLGFSDYKKAIEHYRKHGEHIKKILGHNEYTLEQYIKDANLVIREGSYIPELNAYVKHLSGSGEKSKYLFVGITSNKKHITTFHIKSAKKIIKKVPGFKYK